MKRGLLFIVVVSACLLFVAVFTTRKTSVVDTAGKGEIVEQESKENEKSGSEKAEEVTEVEEVEEEVDHGGLITYETPVRVVFDHELHLDAGMECDSCHDELFAEEALAVEAEGDFNMATFKEGKYCGACHDGETSFHIYSQCESCHAAPKETIYFTKPVLAVIFDHKVHVGRENIKCEECHKEIFTMDKGKAELKDDFIMADIYCEGADVKYCGVCHNNERAFADNTRCTVCHIGIKDYNKIMAEKMGKTAAQKKGH